jgi:V8-like Glu-specific endopeptidase
MCGVGGVGPESFGAHPAQLALTPRSGANYRCWGDRARVPRRKRLQVPPMAIVDVLAADASKFPFIGYIQASFPRPKAGPGGLEIGTGSLIAPRLVLTAAHMLYDSDQGGQVVSVDITFGGPQGYKFQSLSQVDFPMEWRNGLDTSVVSPYDIGVIGLHEPIDHLIAPVPFHPATDAELAGMLLNVGGYPAFPPQGPRGVLWGNSSYPLQNGALPADLVPYESFRLFYAVNTLPGMSGGPVYNYDAASQARTVRGIHTAGLYGLGGTALRITEDVNQLIQHWVKTFPP